MSGQLQNFTIDQFAGSDALIIGSIGALLTIIWQGMLWGRCAAQAFQRRVKPTTKRRLAEATA